MTGASNLTIQKRLAASILKCGKRKIWLDPSETSELALATSRQAIRKQIKNKNILRKKNVVHSRARKQLRDAAVRKGRHTGFGKRRGTANARLPFKRKYRKAAKIDKKLYNILYKQVKGARYKTKKALMEEIHKRKTDSKREKATEEQAKAAKAKASKRKDKKAEK